jgi:hypothetical protein
MAAQKAERQKRLVRLLSLSALACGGLLLWLFLWSAATASSPDAVAADVLNLATHVVELPTATPTAVGSTTPTAVPTATARRTPRATATAKVPPTATSVVNGGNGGGGGVINGPTGPQQTEVALSQPTVEGGSSPLGGLATSSFGANGLLIATTLGCVVAVLGIAVGAIAFYALVQNGYGPFLRALALGTGERRRRKSATGDTGWGNVRDAPLDARARRPGSGWNTPDNRQARPPVSRRDRDGW